MFSFYSPFSLYHMTRKVLERCLSIGKTSKHLVWNVQDVNRSDDFKKLSVLAKILVTYLKSTYALWKIDSTCFQYWLSRSSANLEEILWYHFTKFRTQNIIFKANDRNIFTIHCDIFPRGQHLIFSLQTDRSLKIW